MSFYFYCRATFFLYRFENILFGHFLIFANYQVVIMAINEIDTDLWLLWYRMDGLNVMFHLFLEFHDCVFWSHFLKTNSYSRLLGTGFQRCSIARDDHFITLVMLRKRNLTTVEVRNRLPEVPDMHVNERIRRPAYGRDLTRQHRASHQIYIH